MIDKDKTICSDSAESFRISSLISGGKNFILDYKGQKFSLSLSPFFIGRDKGCSLTIESKQVSRQHCVLYRFGNKFIVRDLHSTNGIKLNGNPITSENIRPGDVIQIGTEQIKVEQGKVDLPYYTANSIVLFLDVVNFTALSERHGNMFQRKLQEFLENLEDTILKAYGCPVKILGDGMMVSFGLWPVTKIGYSAADNALAFALYAQSELSKASVKLVHGRDSLNFRCGIAYGKVNYYAHEGLDILGDTVNLASRLETINKVYGTKLLMNDAFYKILKKKAHIREIDNVRVKGLKLPQGLYAFDEQSYLKENNLTEFAGDHLNIRNANYLSEYEKAFRYYKRGQFDEAYEAFSKLAKEKDKPSKAMAERIETIKKDGAPSLWRGVWDFD